MKRDTKKQIEAARRIITKDKSGAAIDLNITEMRDFIRRLKNEELYTVLYDAFLLGLAVGDRAGRRAARRVKN